MRLLMAILLLSACTAVPERRIDPVRLCHCLVGRLVQEPNEAKCFVTDRTQYEIDFCTNRATIKD